MLNTKKKLETPRRYATDFFPRFGAWSMKKDILNKTTRL